MGSYLLPLNLLWSTLDCLAIVEERGSAVSDICKATYLGEFGSSGRRYLTPAWTRVAGSSLGRQCHRGTGTVSDLVGCGEGC